MTETTTIDFDQDHCHGHRTNVGMVDVDSGTMAITAAFAGNTNRILDHLTHSFAHGDGYVASTTAYGDGSYLVVTVTAENAVVGVEVLFESPALDTADEDRTTSPRTDGMELQAIYDADWDEVLPAADPVDHDLTPHVVTALDVDRLVGIGDPCYGAPSLHVELPSGRYVAVVWLLPAGEVARLALYRQ